MDDFVRLLTRTAGIAAIAIAVSAGAATPSPADSDKRGGYGDWAGARHIAHSARSASSRVDLTASSEDAQASKSRQPAPPAGGSSVSRSNSPVSTALSRFEAQHIVTTACLDGVVCTGRQGNALNPSFWAAVPTDAASAPAAADTPARTVTVEDVAHFLPADVRFHAEPDGWAVVGVPTNFWTYVTPVAVEGRLLGQEAAVRFTPRLYEWRYGDGTTKVTTTGGSSWAGAGQEELTATPTSHLYAAKAQVDASVTVIWSAEYRFAGGDWIRVDGAVSDSSPARHMLVVKERTVLTAR